MRHKRMFSLLVLAGCLVFTAPSFAQTCADVQGTGCAPSPLDGNAISLTGIVYVVNGTYNSGSVYINCGAGGNGGITFFDSGAVVAEGDEITVSGTVGAFGDEIQINTPMFTVNSSGNPYTAETIGTADLADGTPHMGGFMQVSGVLAKVSDGFNTTYSIDDGSGLLTLFVDGTTGIDIGMVDASLGQTVTVRGSTKCFGGVGEILPRSIADFDLATIPVNSQTWSSVKRIYR